MGISPFCHNITVYSSTERKNYFVKIIVIEAKFVL